MDDINNVTPTPADTGGSGSGTPTPDGSTAVNTVSDASPVTAESLLQGFFAEQTPSAQESAPEPPAIEPPAPIEAADSAVSEDEVDPQTLPNEKAWEHIKGLREVKKALEPKAKSYDAIQEQLTNFGLTEELLTPGLELFSGLLATTETGEGEYAPTTMPFLEGLREKSAPRYTQLIADVAASDPDRVLQQFTPEQLLAYAGLNPELLDVYSQVQADGTLNGQSPVFHDIPAHLREAFQSFDEDTRNDLMQMEEKIRNVHLQNQARLLQIEQQTALDKQQAAAEKEAARERRKDEQLTAFTQEQRQAFLDSLKESFNPFGEEEGDLANFFYEGIYNQVSAALWKSPQVKADLEALGRAVREEDGIEKSRLLSKLNVQITKERNAAVKRLNDRFFLPALQAAQQQRQVNASQTQINGTGGFSANRSNDALPNAQDVNDPANLAAIAQSVGFQFKR